MNGTSNGTDFAYFAWIRADYARRIAASSGWKFFYIWARLTRGTYEVQS